MWQRRARRNAGRILALASRDGWAGGHLVDAHPSLRPPAIAPLIIPGRPGGALVLVMNLVFSIIQNTLEQQCLDHDSFFSAELSSRSREVRLSLLRRPNKTAAGYSVSVLARSRRFLAPFRPLFRSPPLLLCTFCKLGLGGLGFLSARLAPRAWSPLDPVLGARGCLRLSLPPRYIPTTRLVIPLPLSRLLLYPVRSL